MLGVERFPQYLWGRKPAAVTDHKPLLGLLGPDKAVPVQASPRVVPAVVREPAEVFMREHAYPEVLSRSAVSQSTNRDLVLSQVVKAVSRGEELVQRVYSHKATEDSLRQGCLLWGSRSVIAQSLWSRVLQLLHSGVTISALQQVFPNQELPDVIASDNGPAFASTEYLAWLTKNGIRRMMVPPFHPASKGAAECVVQTIKDKLKKSQAGDSRTQFA
ncbi:uncharacterized protein [Dermacentor albipictus]|uniref:uncharacterized protein n=1 Tax=Dermacentor albipictus TaxID=60249 RepID=UPI0038FC1740